jgi:hypothetical protein
VQEGGGGVGCCVKEGAEGAHCEVPCRRKHKPHRILRDSRHCENDPVRNNAAVR